MSTDKQIVGRMSAFRRARKMGYLPAWKEKRVSAIPGFDWNPTEHYRTPQEWVPIAEELAKQNGGKLATAAWLDSHGYNALVQIIHKYPELFAHIPQERTTRSLEEWVVVAEETARKHSGILPGTGWLRIHGLSGLDSQIRKCPEAFRHIERANACKSVAQWVSIAEKLAHDNGGALQGTSWLRTHGHRGLAGLLYQQPEVFSHIPQEVRGTRNKLLAIRGGQDGEKIAGCLGVLFEPTPQRGGVVSNLQKQRNTGMLRDHVQAAELLADESGGALQGVRSLMKISGLYDAMRNHPEAFTHIPLAIMKGRFGIGAIRGGRHVGAALAQKLGVPHYEQHLARAIAK